MQIAPGGDSGSGPIGLPVPMEPEYGPPSLTAPTFDTESGLMGSGQWWSGFHLTVFGKRLSNKTARNLIYGLATVSVVSVLALVVVVSGGDGGGAVVPTDPTTVVNVGQAAPPTPPLQWGGRAAAAHRHMTTVRGTCSFAQDQVPEGDARLRFGAAFAASMAQLAGVESSAVSVSDIVLGSIVVYFTIQAPNALADTITRTLAAGAITVPGFGTSTAIVPDGSTGTPVQPPPTPPPAPAPPNVAPAPPPVRPPPPPPPPVAAGSPRVVDLVQGACIRVAHLAHAAVLIAQCCP